MTEEVHGTGLRGLTVLYDASCGLCRGARGWLEEQDSFVPLRFVAAGQEEARRLFPQLDSESTLRELTVVGSDGAVYRGEKAWIVCLWALRDYRSMALHLASPGARWAAKHFVETVSRNRHRVFRTGSGI